MTLRFTQNDRTYPAGTRVCEICGKEGIIEYMYAMGASWQVTGHTNIIPFNCQKEPTSQHWGCCPEHAIEALIDCLQHDEHMSAGLMKRKHQEAADQGLPKIAAEHEKFAAQNGPEFYIVGQVTRAKG